MNLPDNSITPQPLRRRAFLQVAGATAASAALALAGCSKDETTTPVDPYLLNLGAGDVGLLNYAYVLEQLEAAFYQKVVDAPPGDLQAGELAYFNDLRDHELVHRQLLAFALASATTAVPALTFDFSSLTLTTRAGVLAAAKTIEELGVAAYSGIMRVVSDTATLGLITKILSVEARHAALVSDLLTPGSFASDDAVVSTDGLASVAAVKTPTAVVAEIAPFLLPFKLSVATLPVV